MPTAAAPDSNAAGAVRQFEEGPSWVGAIPEIVAITVMATVLLFIRSQFSPVVEPALLGAWLTYMSGCVAARVVILGISASPLRRRLPHAIQVRAGQLITLAFCIGIMASVWILMPPADDLLRMLMILLCMWYLAMVIVLNADSLSALGALGVIGSMAVFVLAQRLPYAFTLAGFLAMEGAALIMIRRAMSRSAAKLQAALSLVHSERDAKTRFIASASHDLQQPLQAARLYFEHALTADDDRVRQRAIGGVRSAFASTAELLQSMLEHLRLEADAVTSRPTALKLDVLLPTIANEQAPSAQAAAMQIRTISTQIEITADEHLLRRVIHNLLSNALRHSHGTKILLAARRRELRTEICIIDNGVGVEASEAGRVFDDFYQGSDGTTSAGGFGLGLASAKRMAALLGGTLELDPRWQRGCAFVLSLPNKTEKESTAR
jgi:signal transduction histidine kinase